MIRALAVRLLLAAMLVILASGCDSRALTGAVADATAKLDPLDNAVRGINASQIALAAQHEALTIGQTTAERIAVESAVASGGSEADARANVAKVRPAFVKAWDAYAAAREAWMKAHAAATAAVALRAAGKSPDVAHVLAAVAALAVAWDAIEATTPTGSVTK